MRQTTLSPVCGPVATGGTLPSAPDVAPMREQGLARLNAIENAGLPALAIQRARLERTWAAEDGDAVPLFTMEGETILAHPAGADRLAEVLSAQEALAHEASALRELVAALELYEAGGSATLRAVGERVSCRTAKKSKDRKGQGHCAEDERGYTRWVLAYLLDVKREMWVARKRRDGLRLEVLRVEFRELEDRVQRRAAAASARPLTASDATPLSLTA